MAYGYRNARSGEADGATIAQNMLAGVQAFGQNMRQAQLLEENDMRLADERGMRQAYEHLAGKLGQGADISQLEGDPVLNTRHGIMALGRLTADRAATEESRLAMLKNMEAADDKLYQDFFRPLASQAQEAYQKGDMAKFGQLVGQLSKVAPFPYQYQMGTDGNFTEKFRSTADGGWVDTGTRMTPQQVFSAMQQLMSGEVQMLRGADMQTAHVNPYFLAAAARYRMGTILSNAQTLADPGKWIPMEKGGHVVYAIPQNSHTDYSAEPACLIHDPRGGSRYGSMRDLVAQGYTPSAAAAATRRYQQDGRGRGSGGGRVSADHAKLIEKLSTVKDAEGKDRLDPGMARILTQAAGLGIHPYDARVRFDQLTDAAFRAIKERNPAMNDDEAARHAGAIAAQSFFQTPATPQQKGNDANKQSSETPNTAPPNAAQGIGGLNPPFVGPQRPAWYEEPGWASRKLSEAWQGVKDSFDSSKRGNVIPDGY